LSDWCKVHVKDYETHDTTPEMPAFREVIEEDGEDRWVVASDVFANWLATQEPRIPLRDYVKMFGDTGEDELPTMPECPIALSEHDTEPPPSGP
jgi:hypothetical protein